MKMLKGAKWIQKQWLQTKLRLPRLSVAVWSCVLLAGCGAPPPAPVSDAVRDLLPEEKPELRVVIPKHHTIRSGETLVGIAYEYGLDYQELALWNGISNPDSIYAGDRLLLSAPERQAVASAVAPQKTQALAPTGAAGAAGSAAANTAIAVAPVIVPAAPAASAASSSAGLGGAPVKEGPTAAKYAYSDRTLKKLRSEHSSTAASIAKPGAAPSAPSALSALAAPAAAAATAATAASSVSPDSPQQVRRRFEVDWSWPAKGTLTRKFSEASKGIDIAGPKGDPVFAAADGKVVYTGSGVKSYGRLVILKHENDYLSAYAHNDEIMVKEGQQISRGQQIATIGDSGAAQVMLHLEIRKSGKPFDPLQVLPSGP